MVASVMAIRLCDTIASASGKSPEEIRGVLAGLFEAFKETDPAFHAKAHHETLYTNGMCNTGRLRLCSLQVLEQVVDTVGDALVITDGGAAPSAVKQKSALDVICSKLPDVQAAVRASKAAHAEAHPTTVYPVSSYLAQVDRCAKEYSSIHKVTQDRLN